LLTFSYIQRNFLLFKLRFIEFSGGICDNSHTIAVLMVVLCLIIRLKYMNPDFLNFIDYCQEIFDFFLLGSNGGMASSANLFFSYFFILMIKSDGV
jgi:hypothetical protein